MNLYKKDIDKIYKKIDGFAKKGTEALFDYYIYIDKLIDDKKYLPLQDCMQKYYSIDIKKYIDIDQFKRKSWKLIGIKTESSNQESIHKLYDKNNVYQLGYNIYKKTELIRISASSSTGSGSVLEPIIMTGSIVGVNILKGGSGYSNPTYLNITGGDNNAVIIPGIRLVDGKIISASISYGGTNYNNDRKIGEIKEIDTFITYPSEKYYIDIKFDEILKWKKTDLEVLKITSTYSETTLISGSYSPNYDKDLYEKYKLAINYII